MWRSNKYDISNTAYTKRLDAKTEEYNALINRAGQINRDNNGKPSKKEAELYVEAIRVCEEIMGMNVGQPSVKIQWEQRKLFCEDTVDRIVEILAPPKIQEEPEEQKEKQTVSGGKKGSEKSGSKTSSKGFHSEFASKEVPIETIESWFKDIPETGFEQVVGKDDLKKRLLMEAGSIGWDKVDSALSIGPVQCYFFYGPPGSGKTFIIEAFVNELKKKYKDTEFSFMQLLEVRVLTQKAMKNA